MPWNMFHKVVWDKFIQPDSGEITEVRGIGAFGASAAYDGFSKKGVVIGYFDEHDAFSKTVGNLAKVSGVSIYFTPNVINPNFIGRACNRMKVLENAVQDKDVRAYRWLLVDLDPVRLPGTSSSDEELARAMDLREKICDYCTGEMAYSAPIKAMSGNGAHLMFRLADLPAQDPKVQKWIKNTLEELHRRFSNEHVKVDTSVHNPARIWKLYGTKAIKGDPVPPGKNRVGRPHRLSYIDSLGD